MIQHIYEKYGRDRAGIAATIIHYRPRSAVREVGKVMGLSEDVCAAIASNYWGSMEAEVAEERARDAGLDMNDPHLKRTMKLAEQLIGMPRHLSQHVGGFILTERPLTETVPIGNGAMEDRTFIEWDKDDIEELGILKIDVLALGMLTCIRKCFDLIEQHHGERWELATVPQEVPEVYDMLCRGDSLGVFQVESRAQMNMLPRLKPRCFYDLVIEVAIVRPGPIQGDMVHPYLKRRSGKEPVTFPCPDPAHGPPDELEKILGRTLGVPIFQEQAMKIALDAAKFSSEEANQLRKAMATFRITREHRGAAGQDGRADGGTRLRSRFRPALLRPDQGLRRIWLPRKPRRELRAPRLRVELAQVEISGRLRLRAAQFAADGLLRAGADRPRCARAWRRGARGRREPQRLGLHTWRTARLRLGLRQVEGLHARRPIGWSAGQALCERRGSSQPRAACRCMRSTGWRRPMRSGRWTSTGGRRYGTRARSSRRRTCPCSLAAEARDEGAEREPAQPARNAVRPSMS